jgi:methanol metabolism-related c-type cytochrome
MKFWSKTAIFFGALGVMGVASVALAGDPAYNIKSDGTVDFPTYAGFRRYHADCHVCHGPDALGSTYAPALADSLKKLSYDEVREVIVNGRKNGTSVMPAFGTNRDVMCHLDDLYTYLKARSDGALQRGRPEKHDPKSKPYSDEEDSCLKP